MSVVIASLVAMSLIVPIQASLLIQGRTESRPVAIKWVWMAVLGLGLLAILAMLIQQFGSILVGLGVLHTGLCSLRLRRTARRVS